MTRGSFLILVWSNEDVDTDHVKADMVSTGSQEGRALKMSVEEEKRVNPVSLGDEVTPAKN